MNLVKFWFDNARPMTLPQSILPALTALFLSIHAVGFVWWLAVLAVFGVVLAHLGLNLFDDYFDTKKKKQDYREELVHTGMRARIGKTPYLLSGAATEKQLLIASCIFCGLAVLIGSVIFWFRGINIVYIAAITAFIGIQYSAPPLRLSYRGMGELIIGVVFGCLNMIGVAYAASGVFSPDVILLSIPVGFLVMNIVYIHSILDYIPDKMVGKNTLAVLLGNQKAMLVLLFFILFIPFFAILVGIFWLNIIGLSYLFLFLLLPLAISLFKMMVDFVKTPDKKFTPKFWLGAMENWDGIKEAGLDWFMIRWYAARNLVSFFCVIIIVISIVSLFV
jgi:1,4-dihydroxy-2-naphthoate octaprenyltransferase